MKLSDARRTPDWHQLPAGVIAPARARYAQYAWESNLLCQGPGCLRTAGPTLCD
jgi:hypothetical protein